MNDPLDDLAPEEENALKAALSGGDIFSAKPSAEYSAGLRRRLLDSARGPRTQTTARPHRAMAYWFGAVAITVAFLAVFWATHSTPAWASALRLARQMPWIHIRLDRDGLPIGESWVSPQRNLFASKLFDVTVFCDYETATFVKYDAQRHAVYRAADPARLNLTEATGSFSFLPGLFQRSASVNSFVPNESVERWVSRRTILNGTPVDEYEITVRHAAGGGAQIFVLTVDRTSSLPRALSFLEQGSHRLTSTFDYPVTGPANAQSLGIPVDVRIEDKDKQEPLSIAVSSLKDGTHNFDDYEALCVINLYQKPQPLARCTVKRVLRRGNKWRVDEVLIPNPHLYLPADPNSGLSVWRANRGQLRYAPLAVCDGQMWRFFKISPGIAGERSAGKTPVLLQTVPLNPERVDESPLPFLMPERACRPLLWGADRVIEVIKAPDGAESQLLHIKVRSSTNNTAADYETMALDPTKDYVAARILRLGHQPLGSQSAGGTRPVTDSFSLDDFQRSPGGFWYATRCLEEPIDKSPARITRFYVDFSEPPAPSLFEVSSPTP